MFLRHVINEFHLKFDLIFNGYAGCNGVDSSRRTALEMSNGISGSHSYCCRRWIS